MKKRYSIFSTLMFYLVLAGLLFWYQMYNIVRGMAQSDLLYETAPAVAEKTEPSKICGDRETRIISQICSTILSSMHYLKKTVTPELSVRFYQEYLKKLDPQKMFFTKDQVEEWNQFAPEMLNQLADGKQEPAFLIYNQYLVQLNKYKEFVKQFTVTEKDLKRDEVLDVDRKNADWYANDAELKEYWRKKLTNDVILLKILEKINLEKKNQAKTKWTKISPEEQVRKRTLQFISEEENITAVGVIEHYLNAYAALYDPHTEYMAPETEEDFNINMSLSLCGIGAVLSTAEDGSTRIVEIMPGGPAMKCGQLHAEDRIIAVAQGNDEPVDVIDMPLKKVVSKIRGPVGSEVVITVLDAKDGSGGTPKTVRLIREEIELKESEAKSEVRVVKDQKGNDRRIAIINLPSFYHDFEGAAAGKKDYKSSTKDVQNLLNQLQKEGKIDTLVMDLRSNGGGSLSEAINLTGLFIPEGPVVQVLNADGTVDVEYDRDGGSVAYSGPLIVLTSRFSASSSEIFAGAIQDYGRGMIIGDRRTHGKGTVQTMIDINHYFQYIGLKFKGGALKLTKSKFYRVNGHSTQLKGIEPDLVLPSYTDAMELGEERLDNPMPWDTIMPVFSARRAHTLAVAQTLKPASDRRIRENKEWQYLNAAVERYRKSKDKKFISLNFDVRWKEYLEQKRVLEEQEAHLGNSSQSDNAGKKKDIFLDEITKIAADYAEF